MRVVWLLPATTEIVCALGALEDLAGVSYDCDHPPDVRELPRVTRSLLEPEDRSGAGIDRAVREGLAEHGTLYRIDEALLRRLAPDVILSQRLCDVCAPAHGSVTALACELPGRPRVLNLEPTRLDEVFANVRTVAQALERGARGEALVRDLQARVARVREATQDVARRPTCVVLEWLDPPFRSGHWVPELVSLAGGREPLSRLGARSTPVAWEHVVAAAPDVLVIAPCGQSIAASQPDLARLRAQAGWSELPAVQKDHVYVMDGSAYLSRPGPRLVDALEILAGVLHPSRFPQWRPERRPSDMMQRVGAAAPHVRPTA
ncbi:MAG: ABC transporter substrate-binding protein [Trueperaceae bacterium]|nr:ABC transporter substrate-binding protein [Trueperaceae bacterium]